MELDDEIHARAKACAALQRVSLREYVAAALAERIERDERKPRNGNNRGGKPPPRKRR